MTKRTRNARAGSIMFVAVVLLLACATAKGATPFSCCLWAATPGLTRERKGVTCGELWQA